MSARRPLSTGISHLSVVENIVSGSLSRRSSTSSSHGDMDTGSGKPRVTKSRNGCITCKAKRLKCDETKPTCLQCKKRGVDCGGYKKSFKWKSFDESSFNGEGSSRARETAQQDDDSGQSPMSPLLAISPDSNPLSDSRSPHTCANISGCSGAQIPTLSLPVPQRQRQDPQSPHFPYGQSSGLKHFQMPGFPGMSGHIPTSSQNLSGTGTIYAQDQNTALDAVALEAMIAQEMNSPLASTGYYSGFESPAHVAYQQHLTPESNMQYQQPGYSGSSTTEAHFGQQTAFTQDPFSVFEQWPAGHTEQQIDFDDPAVQQAVAEILGHNQEDNNQSSAGRATHPQSFEQ